MQGNVNRLTGDRERAWGSEEMSMGAPATPCSDSQTIKADIPRLMTRSMRTGLLRNAMKKKPNNAIAWNYAAVVRNVDALVVPDSGDPLFRWENALPQRLRRMRLYPRLHRFRLPEQPRKIAII